LRLRRLNHGGGRGAIPARRRCRVYAGTTRDLIRQHSIEALIQAHDDAKADLAEAGRLIGQAAQRIQAAQIGEDYHNGIAWPHNMTPERLAS
jgi:hypothetical protein